MYPFEWADRLKGALRGRPANGSRVRDISPVVWSLGLTSFFTDISSEMVGSILPVYLVLHLHMSPLQFAAIDGIYNGLSIALVAIVAGVLADRSVLHKQVAIFGYALSAVCKLGLVLVGGAWALILLVVGLDRLGKGIRTAPRDSMISLSSRPEALGAAFGVHRAMDSAGALLGPLFAFLLLAALPAAFDVLWLISFVVAGLGVAALVLLVPFARKVPAVISGALSQQAAAGRVFSRRFFRLVACGAVLALLTVSDGFLYLILQERSQMAPGYVPLLYVGTALAYMVFAVPAGLLADRIGRTRVFATGYAMLIALYFVLYAADEAGAPFVLMCLGILGLYYAATEGVLMALASSIVGPGSRTTGLALIATSVGVGKLLSSVAFGWLWQFYGFEAAILSFAAAGVLVVIAVSALLSPRGEARAS